jgi:hypothetical protein
MMQATKSSLIVVILVNLSCGCASTHDFESNASTVGCDKFSSEPWIAAFSVAGQIAISTTMINPDTQLPLTYIPPPAVIACVYPGGEMIYSTEKDGGPPYRLTKLSPAKVDDLNRKIHELEAFQVDSYSCVSCEAATTVEAVIVTVSHAARRGAESTGKPGSFRKGSFVRTQ